MELDGEAMMQEYNHIYKLVNEAYHFVAKRLGLTDSVFDILYAIYVLGEGCTQKDICGYSGSSKQTIQSSMRKLERQGFLRMERGGGKGLRIFATPEGKALIEEKIVPVVEAEKRALLDHVDTMMWGLAVDVLRANAVHLREEFEKI